MPEGMSDIEDKPMAGGIPMLIFYDRAATGVSKQAPTVGKVTKTSAETFTPTTLYRSSFGRWLWYGRLTNPEDFPMYLLPQSVV